MNTRYLLTLCTALVVGGGTHHRPATAVDEVQRDDTGQRLVADGENQDRPRCRWSGQRDGRSMSRPQGTVVMLRGKVDSDAAKQAAEEITKMLDGVKTVKNDLEVVAPSKREAVEEKDEAITTRVKRRSRRTHI